MGRLGLTVITFFILSSLSSLAFAQRTERSALWREWATLEAQWTTEKRTIEGDRARFLARVAAQAKAPPPPSLKKSK